MENIFAHKLMTEGQKVTLVATQFRNDAAIWSAELQKKRMIQNMNLVETWIEIPKFLPVNYSRDLRLGFQDLEQ